MPKIIRFDNIKPAKISTFEKGKTDSNALQILKTNLMAYCKKYNDKNQLA